MIYLASPYSDPSEQVMEQRYLDAQRAMVWFMCNRMSVISVVCHWHPIAKRFGLPRDAAFWAKYDKNVQRRCDMLYVLRLSGWQDSKGVTREIELAKVFRQPVRHCEFKGEELIRC